MSCPKDPPANPPLPTDPPDPDPPMPADPIDRLNQLVYALALPTPGFVAYEASLLSEECHAAAVELMAPDPGKQIKLVAEACYGDGIEAALLALDLPELTSTQQTAFDALVAAGAALDDASAAASSALATFDAAMES